MEGRKSSPQTKQQLSRIHPQRQNYTSHKDKRRSTAGTLTMISVTPWNSATIWEHTAYWSSQFSPVTSYTQSEMSHREALTQNHSKLCLFIILFQNRDDQLNAVWQQNLLLTIMNKQSIGSQHYVAGQNRKMHRKEIYPTGARNAASVESAEFFLVRWQEELKSWHLTAAFFVIQMRALLNDSHKTESVWNVEQNW